MDKMIYEQFTKLLHRELIPAMGCTEPIAIAYAGATAKKNLGKMPEHCHVKCSGNIVKNVKGVVVPKSGGLRGIEIAAILGIVGGDSARGLDVLDTVTQEDLALSRKLLGKNFCDCELAEGVANLYLSMEVVSGEDSALVEISNYHTNITRIERNGQVIFAKTEKAQAEYDDCKKNLCVKNILEYADSLEVRDIKDVLEKQLEYNCAIAKEGLSGKWGVNVGKNLLEMSLPVSRSVKAAAWAAAGSDARMNGCAMPVMINSGSGNQGMAVCLPVYSYAEDLDIPHEDLLRALAAANLISLHQKRHIGSLSAYCGATSAACGAACGIAYMLCGRKMAEGTSDAKERHKIICAVITNTICTIGGMACDGAKSSCAAKIAAAVQTALLSLELSFKGLAFQPGEGLVMEDIEDTISAVGRMGRDGMKSTDTEILNMMLGN
ncbi:MAG: serine dehydratase subunit alpha family protein [Dorea sp.]|nr:serine dehydratase subunit alpha family protein [Dorea sp.]